MLKQRVLTVVVVLPLFMAVLFVLPNKWWSAAMIAPLLVAAHEWARLSGLNRAAEAVFLAALVVGCAWYGWFADKALIHSSDVRITTDRAVYAISLGFWCVIAPCWLWLKLVVRNRLVLALTGLLVLLPAWLALARLQNDARLLLLLLAVVWIADSAAYLCGRRWGRRKLAPAISPGKTWAGAGGAFVAIAVYAALLQLFAPLVPDPSVMVFAFFGMTALSIVGDLFESWLKRQAGVKDSGKIFPGHGGMLDRIDGVTAALPLAALMFI